MATEKPAKTNHRPVGSSIDDSDQNNNYDSDKEINSEKDFNSDQSNSAESDTELYTNSIRNSDRTKNTDTADLPIHQVRSSSTVLIHPFSVIDTDLEKGLIEVTLGRLAPIESAFIKIADLPLFDFKVGISAIKPTTSVDPTEFLDTNSFLVNVAPAGLVLTGGSIAENSTNGAVVGTIKGTDQDANSILTYTLLNDAGGRFAIDASTGVVTVADGTRLDFEAAQSYGITVRVTDQGGLFFDKSFTVNVTDVNEAPSATADHVTTNEDAPLIIQASSLTANDSDPDHNPLTVTSVGNALHGAVSLQNGNVIFIPDANFSGIAKFDYTVSDGHGGFSTATVTVDVAPVADAPALAASQPLGSQTVALKTGSEILVNTITAGGQLQPSIASLANGNFVVTWTDTGGQPGDFNGDAVAAQLFDASGAKIGNEFLVNRTKNGSQRRPQVTALTGGGFVVTWEDANGTNVKAQVFNAGGGKVGGELRVNTLTSGRQDAPSITALSNGGFVVTWEDNSHLSVNPDGTGADLTNFAIKARIFDSNGNEIHDEFLVNVTTNGTQTKPSITALTNGGFVVTWVDNSHIGGDTKSTAVKARIFDAAGVARGDEFLINTITAGAQDFPSITALTNGGFVVTWEDFSGAGGDADSGAIKAQIFNATGSKVGGEFLVNTTTTGAQTAPKITALANGNFVVIWEDNSTGTTAIKAQVFNACGSRLGGEFQINAFTENNQTFPAITALGNGGFLVAWSDTSVQGSDGDSFAIKAQAFTIANATENTPLPLDIATGLTDIDGSEALSLTISNIPVDAILTDGTHTFKAIAGNTSADISNWTLANLTITPPLNFSGEFQLTVTATATDTATLSTGVASNAASATQTIDIVIAPKMTGGLGNDVLSGTAGNDILTGNGGNDVYLFGRGGGQDQIINGLAANTTSSGELDLGTNISANQLWFQQSGNDLSILIMGSQDKITVNGWFNSSAAQLAEIKTADGLEIVSGLSQLVQAMATYTSANSGFNPTAIAQAPNDADLQTAIAAAWHHS